jgi:voltage-gated potassium channel
MKNRIDFIREMIDDPTTSHGHYFMLFVQSLIIISIISFTLETLPNKSELYYFSLYCIEVSTIILFSIEYVVRIALNKKPLKFVFSIFGLIDLISIFPFYIFLLTGADARAFKVLRILRLLRLFKLFKYNKSLDRYKRAFTLAKNDLIIFGAVALMTIYITGVGIYFCENEKQPEQFSSIFDGIWWAIVTLTTVGYGDTYPITTQGKMFTFVILIIGLAIVSVPTALIASALTEARNEEDD